MVELTKNHRKPIRKNRNTELWAKIRRIYK